MAWVTENLLIHFGKEVKTLIFPVVFKKEKKKRSKYKYQLTLRYSYCEDFM